jgi:putative nucleotidyltransferase with HDIG domain
MPLHDYMPASSPSSAAVAQAPARAGSRGPSEGRGNRVKLALDALELFPALSESRNRLLSGVVNGHLGAARVGSAIESDIALTIAVMRLANGEQHGAGRVESVVSALELLPGRSLEALASQVHTFSFFQRTDLWGAAPERFRLHALATQRAAERIAREVGYEHRDRLAVTSMLHDVGKLVLIRAYPGYPEQVHGAARTPEERVRRERRELGVEHALVGGMLARRWRLPAPLAVAIERHHDPEAEGEPAIVRLADMLAHYEQGGSASSNEMLKCARAVGLGGEELRRVMSELPSGSSERPRSTEPCPLTNQELRVLRHLAKGAVYKEIARNLAISASTVRTHLHNIYVKLGVPDRAHAVLLANERGWL